MGVSACFFIVYPFVAGLFPSRRLMAFAWPLGMGWVCFGVGTCLLILGDFHPVHVALFLGHGVFALLCLRTSLSLLTMVLGTGAGFLVLWLWGPVGVLESLPFVGLGYGGIVVVGLLLLLFAYLQRNTTLVQEKNSFKHQHRYANNRWYALRAAPTRFMLALEEANPAGFVAIKQRGELLLENLRTHADALPKPLLKEAEALTTSLSDSVVHLEKVFDRVHRMQQFHQRVIGTSSFLEHALKRLQEAGLTVVLENRAKDEKLQCDVSQLLSVLEAVCLRLKVDNPSAPYLVLHVDDVGLTYPYNSRKVEGLAFGLSTRDSLLHAASRYEVGEVRDYLRAPFDEAVHEQLSVVVEGVHYGVLDLSDVPHTYRLVIPRRLHEIRPKEAPVCWRPKEVSMDQRWSVHLAEGSFWQAVYHHAQSYDLDRLEAAVRCMKESHGGQYRSSKEPYVIHPFIVATYYAQYTSNEDGLVAALLHDVVEDTEVSLESLGVQFGSRVKELVARLSNLHLEGFVKYRLSNRRSKASALSSSGDRVAMLIKLCDRLHNMETLGNMSEDRRYKKSEETVKVFVPLAEALGLSDLAARLLALSSLYLEDKSR